MIIDKRKRLAYITLLLSSILILSISTFLFFKLLFSTYSNQLMKIENSGYRISEIVNKEIAVRSHAVRAMKLMAEQFLKKRVQITYDIHSNIFQVTEKGGYTVLQPEGFSRDELGSVTALGEIPEPDSDKLEEIAMSLYLTPIFRTIIDRYPGTPWVYYTSLNDFIYLYPFVSIEDFFFNSNLYNYEFIRGALPVNNPEGKLFWTDAYSDEAGKGLMVTVSAPVLKEGKVKGAVSTDVSMEQLGRLLRAQKIQYSQVYLISEKGIVLDGTDDAEINIIPADFPEGKISSHENSHITVFNLAVKKWSLVIVSEKKGLFLNAFRQVAPYLLVIIFILVGFILIVKLQNALKMVNELSQKDGLTKLWNRRMFDMVSKAEYAEACRRDKTFGLIIFDIDFFKQYNDTYGHHEGDVVLTKVASASTATLRRSTDYVFRVGGEEFGIITLAGNNYQLQQVAEMIRSSIEELNIPHVKSPHNKLTVSCGAVIVSSLKDADSFETFYKWADSALYNAKGSGRNCVSIYNTDSRSFR